MSLVSIRIENADILRRVAAVYFISITNFNPGLLYIGETCQKHGVIGRLCEHIDDFGTLNRRVREYGVEKVDGFSIVGYLLANNDRFSELSSPKRKALEYCIQTQMRARGCTANQRFYVISNVMHNNMIWEDDVNELAEDIVRKVCVEIPFFR